MVDLTILGGGAAGARAAMLAAKAGFSVVLLECGAAGGGAVHESYWPYRGMLADAASLIRGREGFLGLRMISESHVYEAMLKRAQSETALLSASQSETLKHLGVETVNAAGYVEGLKNHRYIVSAEGKLYESRRLMICTGSVPHIPDFPDVETHISSGFIVTPKELTYQKLPHRAIVAGSGLRNLQMAAWLAANRVQTLMLCGGTRIVRELDPEVETWLIRSLRGIEFLTSSRIASLNHEHAVLSSENGGRAVDCDKIVTGGKRSPATRGIGLNNAGVAIENGAIITDLTCHTNLPDVYAAGDVNMRSLSAAGAFREAEVSVSNMLGRRENMAYRAIPRIFECGVSGASVGETVEEANAMGYQSVCVTVNVGGAAENGFVKLVADDKGRLMGAHLCGHSEIGIIWELAAIIESNADIRSSSKYLSPRTAIADTVQQALLRL